MGGLTQQYHAKKGLPFLEDLLLDVRFALRVLRKSPAFTLVALLTLMLGIGANVVVFGVLNAVLLRPLDVSDPGSLYQIRPKLWASGRLLTTSYPAFEDFRRRNSTFSGMAAIYGYSDAGLRWHNAVMNVSGDEVTGNYFDLLGVQPEAGRFFHEADEHGPGSAPYVVLSDALWRSAFHGDRNVIGTTVDLNKHPFTVVGVAPAQFHGTERFVWPDYWIPMANEEQVEGSDYLHSRTSRVTVIGRLKPGVTPQQATENLNAIVAELAKEYPETDDGLSVRLIHPGLWGDDGDVIRGFLYGVTVLGLLVLAAACANLASLFAARTADRGRELALRVALGSSRRRLVRQLLTEALIVSLMGGAAGLVSADLLLGVLNRWYPALGHLAAGADARLYLAGLALTLGSALLFGIVPARQAWQSSPLQAMKGGPVDSMPLRRFALRDLLLGAQIAICTLLVTAVAGGGARHGARAARSARLPAAGSDAGRDGPERGGAGRRRGAGERESDDRGGAEHPRRDGGGGGETHADERLDTRHSDLPAGNGRVQDGQLCAGDVRVSDVAGIPASCRHAAAERAGRLMAGQRRDTGCGDRERDFRAEDVGQKRRRSDSGSLSGAS